MPLMPISPSKVPKPFYRFHLLFPLFDSNHSIVFHIQHTSILVCRQALTFAFSAKAVDLLSTTNDEIHITSNILIANQHYSSKIKCIFVCLWREFFSFFINFQVSLYVPITATSGEEINFINS